MNFGFAPGESSPEVRDWQQGLNLLGYVVPVTGAFDSATSAATNAFKVNSGLPDDDVVDDTATEALYAHIDQLGSAIDDSKPTVDVKGPQSAMAIVGRAPSWLWWVGAGLVALAGAYTIKQVTFGPRRRS